MNPQQKRLRKSGIYGVIHLDGSPLDRAAAAVLGLAVPIDPGAALVEAVDPQCSGAVHRFDADASLTVLAGELDEPAELAASLGLPPGTAHGELARAALTRFGDELPAEMLGEWSLLHWNRHGGVTAALSAGRRDPMLYALAGRRLAVAPDIYRLGRIAWIGNEIDAAGMLFAVARTEVRAGTDGRTINPRVRELAPGTTLHVAADGSCRLATANILPVQPHFRGSLADALTQTETILRRTVRTRLERTAKPAVLLSGGLDSSLLAWLLSAERVGGQQVVAITSVAPAASGLPDEHAFAAGAADALGLELIDAAPTDDLETFRPSPAILSGANGPTLGNRHCLTESFQRQAQAHGVSLLVNGSYGELTATLRLGGNPALAALRHLAGSVRRGIPGQGLPQLSPFHVQLAPHLMAELPKPIRSAMDARPDLTSTGHDRTRWGYHPGAWKALSHANEFHAGALRMDFPFRDLRLLRFFAGLPRDLLREPRYDRRPARVILEGHLPDSIRLRRSGMPAAPDHLVRMQWQAPQARTRRSVWLKAGADEWLDLDWLDAALARCAAQGVASHAEANVLQLTAIMAEYLVWLRRIG